MSKRPREDDDHASSNHNSSQSKHHVSSITPIALNHDISSHTFNDLENQDISINNDDNHDLKDNIAIIRKKCPYLDTVNRHYLDFDNEKICCVTLSNMNIYACLVCGKFYQGRGKSSIAYTHSVQCGHFVFMNLHDTKSYCLPDSYEIHDTSLDDVKKCLSPKFSHDDIMRLDMNISLARDVYGVSYLPGFVGLNNLKATDYINVVLHALAHIPSLRNYFISSSSSSMFENKSHLVQTFATVIAKIWSSDNFKPVVSPQEFAQEVSVTSKKRFDISTRAECSQFLVWLLQEMHRDIYGMKKKTGMKTFLSDLQGEVEVTTYTPSSSQPSSSSSSYLILSLDIPPCPLFRDSQGGAIIPQVPIFEILKKYDGVTMTDHISSAGLVRKSYKITKLPKYLILHLDRFTKNNFSMEKNPTIITFPVKNFEMRDYFFPADDHDINDLCSKYDLVANICHDSFPATQSVSIGSSTITNPQHFERSSSSSSSSPSLSNPLSNGSYRVHVQHRASLQWYEIQDLHVAETIPQLVGLSESCLLIYEKKSSAS